MKKAFLALLILAAIVAFVAFDLGRFFTLDSLKQAKGTLATWQSNEPWLVAAGYFGLYVVMAALSLPGAAIMTVAGGAIFGIAQGTVLVSFASSLGAVLAFASARFVLRDSVQRRAGDRLKAVNEGMARDGMFYLFTLRLLPIFPFFVVNLLMGLTSIRLRTFYWVSQLGTLPATIVFVYAGTQLAHIQRLSDVASPRLLLSFTILGIFPLIARGIVRALQKRRVYARWRRPSSFDRNLVVIGAGAAGLISAYIAATVRAKVTLVEAHRMGGDCLNYGCVPSKALIRSATLAYEMAHADHYGIEPATPRINFRSVMARIHEVIRAIEPHDSVERYTKLGVEVLKGYARIVDPWTVEVALNDGDTLRLTTRSIVIAAGARPSVPSVPGLEEVGYVTTDTLWEEFAALEAPPRRLAILGGGPVGCELAQSFARLGSTVTQIEMLPRILIREDEEVSAFVRARLEAEGVTVFTDHKVLRVEKHADAKALIIEHQGNSKRIEFDALICATGRTARLEGYGLEALGIETDRTIHTNEFLETLYPNIFAAGDVAGPYQLTHVAAHQAWYAAVNALFGSVKKFKADYSTIPWSTFTDPEVARVGLSEQEAKQRNVPYEVTRYELQELDRAIADSATEGFVKILTVPGKDRILGVTIVAKHAGDLLAEFVLAMKHGLGLAKVLGTIHIYPTLAEANKSAAGEWRRAHAPERLLPWVARYHAWMRT
ncbi:MAG: merA [Gammaproteobacteria bacterium]|nr:merA [Gammaproteobacteria bacterium]